jgi:hypothetical protein
VLDLLGKGEAKTRMRARARILLLSAEGEGGRFTAEVLKVTPQTVWNIPRWFAQEGLEVALRECPRTEGQPKLDAKQNRAPCPWPWPAAIRRKAGVLDNGCCWRTGPSNWGATLSPMGQYGGC